MIKEKDIRDKFVEQCNRKIKERKYRYTSCCYLNCKHNERHRVSGNANSFIETYPGTTILNTFSTKCILPSDSSNMGICNLFFIIATPLKRDNSL